MGTCDTSVVDPGMMIFTRPEKDIRLIVAPRTPSPSQVLQVRYGWGGCAPESWHIPALVLHPSRPDDFEQHIFCVTSQLSAVEGPPVDLGSPITLR